MPAPFSVCWRLVPLLPPAAIVIRATQPPPRTITPQLHLGGANELKVAFVWNLEVRRMSGFCTSFA